MKKQFLQSAAATVLLTVCSVAVVGSPAMAAPPPPPPLMSIYNWTGFYIGGNFGYSWGHGAVNYSDPSLVNFGSSLPTSFSGSNRLNGWIGGFQAGYNTQINNFWVSGVETDIQFSSEKASRSFSTPYTFNDGESLGLGTFSGTLGSKIEWFGTLRGRLGYLINPTTLVYGTAGLAYGQVKAWGSFSDTAGSPGFWSFSQSAFKAGYAVGAGIEGAIPTTKNWTWKAEYLHINLGTLSGVGFNPDFGGTYSYNATFTDDILRFGVNYRLP